MAASALVPTQITRSGIAGTLAAANVDGNYFANTGKEYLEVVNGAGAPINVVFAGYADGITVTSFKTVAVPNGARRLIGPFPYSPYNDTSNQLQITDSSVTSITVAVFHV